MTPHHVDYPAPSLGDIADLQAYVVDLTTDGLPRDDFLVGVLRLLCDFGSTRVRYWASTVDYLGRSVIVLIHALPSGPVAHAVDFTPDFTAHPGHPGRVRTRIQRRQPEVAPKWIPEAAAPGMTWLQIPVLTPDGRFAALVCEFPADAEVVVDNRVRHAIGAVGSQVAAHLALSPFTMLGQLQGAPEEASADLDAFMSATARRLGEALDIAVVSLFRFDWTRQELLKICDHLAAPYAPYQGTAPDESYDADPETTSGFIWLGAQHGEATALATLAPSHVYFTPSATDWLTEVTGGITSVMYAATGALEPRYLVRLINRASRPEVPLVKESTSLAAAMATVRPSVDSQITDSRLVRLQAANVRLADVLDPADAVHHLAEAFAVEGVKDFAVLCHRADSSSFAFAQYVGALADAEPSDDRWQEDMLYRTGLPPGVRTYVLGDRRSPTALGEVLERRGFRGALTVSIQAGQTKGILCVPLRKAPRPGSEGLASPTTFGYGTGRTLEGYAGLIGAVVERRHVAALSEGAIRALGLLGHELRRPLARLGSAAEEALVAAKAILRDAGHADNRDSVHDVDAIEQRLYRAQRSVDAAFRLAPMLIRDSGRELELHRTEVPLATVVYEAVASVERDHRSEGAARGARIDVDSSVRKAGPVYADPVFLEGAIRNVIDNAVKYSLAPTGSQTPAVRVTAHRTRRWVVLTIRNFGFGVLSDERELIFEPWVRGAAARQSGRVAGMGLGLAITRWVIGAHGGDVRLSTQPASDSAGGLARARLPETTAEIRLPYERT